MRHVADIAASFARRFPEDGNCSLGWLSEPGKSSQQGGLPCSVIAEDRVKAARIEFRRNTAQGGKAAELLDQVGYDDDRSACWDTRWSVHSKNLWISASFCKRRESPQTTRSGRINDRDRTYKNQFERSDALVCT